MKLSAFGIWSLRSFRFIIVCEEGAGGGDEEGNATHGDGFHGVTTEEGFNDGSESDRCDDLGDDNEQVKDPHVEAHFVSGYGVR